MSSALFIHIIHDIIIMYFHCQNQSPPLVLLPLLLVPPAPLLPTRATPARVIMEDTASQNSPRPSTGATVQLNGRDITVLVRHEIYFYGLATLYGHIDMGQYCLR